ncbi:hypothetical protein K493DRAFT_314188 [Basidiobolus meristosporus CBS 931.73]|uniref:Uncharacterized protein n=1 Tax=Basidiobolus meristosporus CBS 931.73 TaxID=1314790 RepID=A0A1Y1YGV2_9FUNG|nr:hypothetical protein K493DRAFT_314188 [Basidiobolus meristosporus CBS 931.73]|eukprot:ORX97217.1 hypothetical protein K493DRAFT_314188 [Basidiobolus meristosporus CBS 931.73]
MSSRQSIALRLLLFTLCIAPATVLCGGAEPRKYFGKFLHLTDIHFDPTYRTNASVTQFCHRASDSGALAQTFGTLGSLCDAPVALVESSFEYLKQQHQDIDFVLYTGDSVRHDRDPGKARTSQDVIYDHQRVTEYFHKTFDLNKVKVIPAFGNVDPFMYDQVKEGPSQELSTLLALWKSLGLKLDESFLKGGYYTATIIPGRLEVISLNTNFFYKKNREVLGCEDGSNSPGLKQLLWLQRILETAIVDNTKVYIIGHIPPHDAQGNIAYYESCHRKFAYLLGKHSDIVLASFFGHTNVDSISYVFSAMNEYGINNLSDHMPSSHPGTESILGIIYTAPSIIPFRNPAMRKLSYVSRTDQAQAIGQISDYTQYYVDLDRANREGRLMYDVEYVASTAYKVENLSTESWQTILADFRKPGSPTWEAYQRYREVSPRKPYQLVIQQ